MLIGLYTEKRIHNYAVIHYKLMTLYFERQSENNL